MTSRRSSFWLRILAMAVFAPLFILVQGCSKGGSTVTVTSLAPIVKAALPHALTPGAISAYQIRPHGRSDRGPRLGYSPVGNMATAQGYLAAFFQNYYAVGLSSNIQNFILAQVSEMDGRTALYNGAEISAFACLSSTPATYTLDYSALNPTDTTASNMWKFVMNDVQCNAAFSGPQGQVGSGEIFGVNGTSTSEWVTLTDMAGDSIASAGAFVEAANLTNAGSTSSATPQTVDAISFSYSGPNAPSPQQNRFWLARFKAIPTTNVFELYFASNQMGVGGFAAPSGAGNGVEANIAPGFRLISDGNYVYADGYLCTDTGGTTCSTTSTVSGGGNTITGGNWQVFQVCMSAQTLDVVDPVATSDCMTLANSFTLSPNATSYTISTGIFAGGSTAITQDPFTFTNITGDTNLGDTAAMSVPGAADLQSPELTALAAAANVNNASSVPAYK